MKPLKPELLVKDLGKGNSISVLFVKTLYRKLASNKDPEVMTMFDEWKKHFEEVCGYRIQKPKFDLTQIEMSFNVESPCDFAKLLFSIHTYYALIVKLLAFRALHFYVTKREASFSEFASLERDLLRAKLREIESGKVFGHFGLVNFVEADFFSWYLDAWDENISACVKKVIEILNSYKLVWNNEAQDLLRRLYYDLIPKNVRHRLGEYYTPKWLAQLVIDETGFRGDPDLRFLDPGCGSGTFLVLLISKIKEYSELNGFDKSDTLNKILKNVVGFDLNPLAVLTARVNYLITLGDLLPHKKGRIRIPIYLCDSIALPVAQQSLHGKVYTVETPLGQFTLPVALIKEGRLERLFSVIEHCAEKGASFEEFEHELKRYSLDDKHKELFRILYEQVMSQKSDNLLRLSLKLAREAFAPLLVERFDFLIGNPSWINWDSLPKGYRDVVREIYRKYGLIKRAPKVGAIKIDISILSTYVAIDKYLKDGGMLAFVITQTVFESRSAEGFRRFKLFDNIPIKVLKVHDMVELRPFEGAQNRTAIVLMRKGEETNYPVPYVIWKKKTRKILTSDETLETVKRKISFDSLLAAPLSDDPMSPWAVGSQSLLRSLKPATKGEQFYYSREGVNTGGGNSLYWVHISRKLTSGDLVITNLSEAGRRKASKIEDIEVEPELIYPLVRGRDLKRWAVNFANIYIVIPHTKATGMHALPEEELKSKFPKAYGFLTDPRVEPFLKSRRALIMRWGGATKHWYSLFEIGPYTFSSYKVLYKGEVATDLVAAVANTISSEFLKNKIVIPDQTVHFVPLENPDEAYYVCALLNSSYIRTLYKSLRYKHPSTFLLEYVKLPKFDKDLESHREIAMISRDLHVSTIKKDAEAIAHLEAKLDLLVPNLFNF